MKLSAWHKAQGHETTLVRWDGTLIPFMEHEKVYASAVFTWNREKAEIAAALGADVGGKGYRKGTKLPPEIHGMVPDWSLYGIEYGMGFLSRGCIRDCSFCSVPAEEGLPWLDQTIDAMINPARKRPFIVLMDNEFFWNVKWAIAQMDTFTARGIDWCPSQGLDIRCTTPPLCASLAASPFWNLRRSRRQITFAFDDAAIEKRYRQGVEMLLRAGIKAWQLQSFMLIGYDEATKRARPLHADDHRRIAVMQEYGIDPFAMAYRDNASGKMIGDRELQQFARWVNSHACKTHTFTKFIEHERAVA